MKKKIIIALFLITFLSINMVFAKTYIDHADNYYQKICNKNNLKGIKAFVCDLRERIDNIEVVPGPQGEPGLSAQQGAGNIAFIWDGDPSYLLGTDGRVWLANAYPGVGPAPGVPPELFTEIEGPVAEIPVPVSDIIAWKYRSLLDKDGNYWYFSYRSGPHQWVNFGPLP